MTRAPVRIADDDRWGMLCQWVRSQASAYRWGALHPEGACNAPLRGDDGDDTVDGVGHDANDDRWGMLRQWVRSQVSAYRWGALHPEGACNAPLRGG
jgi:hypothetical protein